MIPSLLLLGAPGVGKSTQGTLLEELYPQFRHIVSSEQLKAYAAAHPDDPRSEGVRAIFSPDGAIRTAKLLDDKDLVHIIKARFGEMIAQGQYDPDRHSALLDGVIRTSAQAQLFHGFFDMRKVLHLDGSLLASEELEARIAKRARPGETLDLFRGRIEEYRQKTLPVLDYYGRKVVTIDPSGTPLEVHGRVMAAIADLQPAP